MARVSSGLPSRPSLPPCCSILICFRFFKDYPLSGGPAQELAWCTVSMFMLFDPGACPAGTSIATRLLCLEKWHEYGIALMVSDSIGGL